MNKIKNLVNKILEIPVHHTLVIILGLIITIITIISGQFSIATLLFVVVAYLLFLLYMKLGSIVPKSVMSVFTVLYATSLYTYLISDMNNYIIQPFFLTIAGTTCFLAMSYNHYNYGLRSRPFWSAFLTVVNVSIKSSIILMGYSFLFAEVIGINIIVLFMLSWNLWLNNSQQTKIVNPSSEENRKDDKYFYLYIEDEINVETTKWTTGEIKNENAYPYIYNKVFQAKEKGLTLIIISMAKTSKIYDVGHINHNKEMINYLYVEGKSDKYLDDIIKQYELEMTN